MNKISRRVSKLIAFELDMLDQIETYMEANGINFTESVRRIISSYFANQTVSTVSINDSKLDDVVKEALEDIPKDTEQPPIDNISINKNDFNWDDMSIDD